MVPIREVFQPEDFFRIGKEEDQLRFLIRFAILAPSSHNSQPWLFRIRGLVVEVWGDQKRAPKVSDENHRQLFVGVGCAIENLLIAADYYGWPCETEFFPEPREPYFVARVAFKGSHYRANQVDHLPHLFFAIPDRHTNRSLFEKKEVPQEFLHKLKNFESRDTKLFFIAGSAERETVAKLVGSAVEAAFSDRAFKNELTAWLKPSLKKYREGLPGYNIGIPWLFSFLAPLGMRYLDVRKSQRKMVEKQLRAAPLFGVIATETDDPRAWVEAGQLYERVALNATASRLKIGIFAAPIQIDHYYQELQSVLGTVFRPQIFFRMGYSESVPTFSPRRKLEEFFF